MSSRIPNIIAICGKRRSGKDTVACMIKDLLPQYEIKKIAEPLKKGIQCFFGFTDDQIETNEKDEIDTFWDIKPRDVMQYIGTEIMQYKINELIPNLNKNFWIKSFIKNNNVVEKYIIISDLRFLHEYNELKKYNCIFIKIENINAPEDNHVSEQEFEKIQVDYIIKNNYTIDQLKNNVFKFVNKFNQNGEFLHKNKH